MCVRHSQMQQNTSTQRVASFDALSFPLPFHFTCSALPSMDFSYPCAPSLISTSIFGCFISSILRTGACGRRPGVRGQVQRPSWGAHADCHGGLWRRRGEPGANLGSSEHGVPLETAPRAVHRKQPVSAGVGRFLVRMLRAGAIFRVEVRWERMRKRGLYLIKTSLHRACPALI